jgi:two-component system phosphate regulon sensor histidine kinase PhoR
MNKKVIFGILALMAIAIVGVIWSQIRLIQSATQVNTERFEKSVFSALNEVVKKLELDEEKDLFLSSMSQKYPNSNVPSYNPFGSREKEKNLENRIKMGYLDGILKEELAIRGINSQIPSYRYHYGIYGFEKGSFVILDGKKFNYEEEKENVLPEYVNTGNENTAFRVNVFPRERPVPGELRIFFPNKNAIILRSLGKTLSATLFFAGIILVCFGYTLYIIFTQKKLSEMKTDFINNMTHEFKTPIATINLALDAIRNPKIIDDKEKVFKYLQMIKEENKRMHAQVENVLRISKLEKKELDISKQSLHITGVLDDAIEHVHLILEDRNGKITKHFDAVRTSVLINEVHFTNVIVNILENAIKYSPEIPIIDVYLENLKDFVVIKIKDNGIGMSKIAQKRVFEKFYREHTGDLHNVKGHGLGLAYVKKIIDDHNGQIFVESEKGKGSTFIIKLPLIN